MSTGTLATARLTAADSGDLIVVSDAVAELWYDQHLLAGCTKADWQVEPDGSITYRPVDSGAQLWL